MRPYPFIFSILVLYNTAYSQLKGTCELYHTTGIQQFNLMPVVHIQNSRNWCAEARYNYEEEKTLSLYLGKTFTGNREFAWSLTPLLGGVIGKFNGISTGLNIDLEYHKFFLSAQSQLTVSLNERNGGFIYSWSELGYQPLRWLYAGCSVQQTYTNSSSQLERGILIGFTFNNVTIPLYGFDVLNRERYFIIGITVNWNSAGKRHSTPSLPFLTDTE